MLRYISKEIKGSWKNFIACKNKTKKSFCKCLKYLMGAFTLYIYSLCLSFIFNAFLLQEKGIYPQPLVPLRAAEHRMLKSDSIYPTVDIYCGRLRC